ncbi:carabin isoform X2 [Macaca thibetana thibetana]|uniref:carabin isoform X2 n=1 Tax=Macaca thibetana thibetana TaxID=257877 RepID=UPI0021BC8D84|nr:carabin isoform X2 [Macaca thibetana thibetana]
MPSQAGPPACRPHPPAGDEVGGDDLALGENHVPAVQEGKDAVPERHPVCPACPVLAPVVRGPCVPEEQPWHLSGAGRGPWRPTVDGDHWQGPAPPVPPARDVCVTSGPRQGLLQVLKAYTLYRPEQGYCQAQGPVAAVLLMHLPPEEAFWCLVQICEVYLPGYYGPHMEAVRLDAEVFMALLRRLLPHVHKHLQQVGVGPLLYLPEWFLCLFARSLPFPTVLRVWDAFLSEGAKVLFRVGLTLVRLALGTAEQRGACPGLLETLGALRAIPPTQLQEEAFMSQVHNVVLSERDLQREIKAQLAQLPDSAPGPPPRPQVRLAGAQAIFEAQQLAGARRGAKPEVPRIVVQPPEEPRPPRRKPQTRGKTFHGLLTRARGPPIEGPPRPQRGSTSFLDTRF